MAAPLESKKPPKMRPPMRSSIACLRCRKSKIKCENNGGTSPCDSCIKTGKDCVFKLPEANPAPPKRSEPPSGVKQERDGGSERKKIKKFDEFSKVDHEKASVYAEETLSAPFLTEDLWEQVLDLYKLHFAPELPFLHLATMKEKLGRKFRSPQPDNSPDFNFVLLGVLTLTARFHPDLVKYLAHLSNNQPGNARSRPLQTQIDPTAASEYYADILTTALGPLRNAVKTASVERVQAWLMLGMYEWSQTTKDTGGLGAWMCVGIAVRLAQYLGLGNNCDHHTWLPRSGDNQERGASYQSQIALEKETKRRTMWSCFILDRMLSCGKERVAAIQAVDLKIQLPCSEDKFDLAMEAQTGFLEKRERGRSGTDDSVLSRFIQLVHIWGKISQYSSQGGRLTQGKVPPWDERNTFYQLSKELEEFDADLPGTFTFSRSNYIKHENHQASSVYVLLHMLRSLCQIMLHREYIPFIPIRCDGPRGPVDYPTFDPDEFSNGWWRRSAEQVFKPARDIVDLIEICQRKDKLPQSTLVLFAVWTASFVGLYAHHFPQMDTERHMLSYNYGDPSQDTTKSDVFQHGPTASTYHALQKMSTWLNMAGTYVGIFRQMDKYFDNIKQDFHKYNNAKKNESLVETADRSIRRAGLGGGLEEYSLMQEPLKGFGPLRPEEHRHIENHDHSRSSPVERSSSVSPGGQTAPSLSRTARSTPTVSFTAINHTPILPAQPHSHHESAYRSPAMPGSHSNQYVNSWRYHSAPHQPVPPPQSYPPTPATMLEPTAIAQQALDQAAPHYENDVEFWKEFTKQEVRRWGATGDLRLLATGDPHDFDLFFAEEPYMSPITDDLPPPYDQQTEYDSSQLVLGRERKPPSRMMG